jgi:hypothetical protein
VVGRLVVGIEGLPLLALLPMSPRASAFEVVDRLARQFAVADVAVDVVSKNPEVIACVSVENM